METEKSGWQRHDLAGGGAPPRRRSDEEPRGASGTFFADGCEADGVLAVETSIALDGEFKGAIVGQGTVTIGSGGAIQADICARSVIVHGAVVGNIDGSREVVLGPTARVHGDIETPSLVIERGAFVVGATRMRAPLPERPALETTTAGEVAPRFARP